MKLFNNNLDFLVLNENNKNININIFIKLLDYFSFICSLDSEKFQLINGKGIFKPFNLIIFEGRTEFLFCIDDKSIIGRLNQIFIARDLLYSDDLESLITNTCNSYFNFNIRYFIKINKNSVLSCINELEGTILDSYDSASEAFKNLYESDKSNLVNLREVLNKEFFKYFDFWIKENKDMYVNPIFKASNITVDNNLIFCALPFDDVRLKLFENVIRPEIEKEFGYKVIKADNIKSNNSIVEDIWIYINMARIVIVDLSKKNPNVFYELGICHALGKQTILICDRKSLNEDYNGKLPFDISGIRTIIYETEFDGTKKLTETINNTIISIVTGNTVIL